MCISTYFDRVRFLRPSGCLVFFCLSRYVSVGDVVVLKDPNETHKYLVRRLAALEGSEMVSSDEKDEPFLLKKDQCWVVAENKDMKSKVQLHTLPCFCLSLQFRITHCIIWC